MLDPRTKEVMTARFSAPNEGSNDEAMFRSERLVGMPEADASSPERAPPSRAGSGGNRLEFRRTTFSWEGYRGSELDRGTCLRLAAPHPRALAECAWADTRQNVADENRIFVT